MKKTALKRALALLLALITICCLCVSSLAFDVPDGYWEALDAWRSAVASKDVDATIKTSADLYDMIKDIKKEFDLCNDILHPLCAKASWCCEIKGDLDGAAMWLERQLEADRWLDDNGFVQTDNIINGEARMKHLTRNMEAYVLSSAPADVPYFGAKGEPATGVLYGTVPEVRHQEDTAALIYIHFNDGYTMKYWLDYYSTMDPVTNRAVNNGGVVEIAWNFKESDAGIDEVLAAESYITDSLKELGSRNCTILLRIGAEMNVWENLPTPEKFISAFRKIATEARKYPNIGTVFSPNDVSNRTVTYDTYYPGDEYVDWFGVSTYQRGLSGKSAYEFDNTEYNNDAFYCRGIYGSDPLSVLEELTAMAAAHKKPMMISECGFAYYNKATGTDQTSFASDRMTKFYSYIPMVYPQVKAMFYFNLNHADSTYNYALSGSPALAEIYGSKVTGGTFIQNGSRSAPGYTKLQNAKLETQPFDIFTYVSLPGEGKTTVKYYVDGAEKGSSGTEPFSVKLQLTAGEHTIKIVASKGQFTKTITRTVKVSEPSTGMAFTDVKLSDWFCEPVRWAVENGITNGTSDTTFSPAMDCQIAHILTFLWRAKGEPEATGENPFTDVEKGAYYYTAALWAYENGLVSGNEFNPTAPCTRSMVVTYLWKLAGKPSAGTAAFNDVAAAADYSSAVAW
ncbi:MAG: S-layer homology domain-containing protein, partial [Oscillospiraceae bacterium]|nr:S-layer homology domain-containing protein [Oscillospiraceae bacterium]